MKSESNPGFVGGTSTARETPDLPSTIGGSEGWAAEKTSSGMSTEDRVNDKPVYLGEGIR